MPRTLIIATLIAICFVVFSSKKYSRKWVVLICVSSLLAAIPVLWYIKNDSSLGRLHIWKLSWQLFLEQRMWQGIGAENFNFRYNHLQAAFFAKQHLYTKEAMLANDGYYAFNDYVQAGIEYGWWAGILLFFVFAWFIWQNVLLLKEKKGFTLSLVYVILLWPVAVGTWVGYPLHRPYVLVFTVVVLILLLVSKYVQLAKWKKALHILCIGVGIFFSISILTAKLQADNVLHESREMWQIGQKHLAIEHLETYCANNHLAIPHYEVLANWYWLINNEAKAIQILEAHHRNHCNQRIHQLLGKWYTLQRNFKEASHHFHTSLYITPHLLISRAYLADMYSLQHKKDSAVFWTNEVVLYPAKLPTEKAEQYKKNAARWLEKTTLDSLPFNLLN